MKVLTILSVLILVLGSSMGKTYLVETADPANTDYGENTMKISLPDPESRRRFLPDIHGNRCLGIRASFSMDCLNHPFGFRLDNKRIRDWMNAMENHE